MKIRYTLSYRPLLTFLIWMLLGLVIALFITGTNVKLVIASNTDSQLTYPFPSLPEESRANEVLQQENRGKELYELEQFVEVVTIWQNVFQAYQQQGDKLNQARVLSNLSLVYQKLGQWSQATTALDRGLEVLEGLGKTASSQSKEQLKVLAQVLNTRGNLELATGQPERALATWQKATAAYTQAEDRTGVIRSSINQSQAFRALGLNRRALSTLTQVSQILEKQPDSPIKAAVLRNLGTNLRLVGKSEQAQQSLQQSLAIAQKLKLPLDISAAAIDLGNIARANKQMEAALDFYQKVVAISPSQILKVRANLNQLSTLIDLKRWDVARKLSRDIESQLPNLPPSRVVAYMRLNFARSLTRMEQAKIQDAPTIESIAQLVAMTVEQAKSIGDKQAEIYALGRLGSLYEATQQWSIARDLTQKALMLAQTHNAPDIAYLWQWQLGRLLKKQGDVSGAIAAYTQAVKNLQVLRNELVGVEPDVQFSFRERVEPVYRELVSLLLQPGKTEPNQESLRQARQVLESLQLAELDNFFQEACLDAKPNSIERFDANAAVIYPIILPDRLEVIISLPQQPLLHYATPIEQNQLENLADKLRQNLVIRSRDDYMALSQQLYDWLLRKSETYLNRSEVKTLVFVLDGVLRNIPMAALHDGKQFLIEKYSIALTPSLQLLPAKHLQQENLKVLSAGLTEARQGFSSLEYVEIELQEIKSEVPSVVLLNQKFTSKNLQKEIQSASFPIVHIATHGNFSSKASETFILTWDGRIQIDEFDSLLQNNQQNRKQAIELLVLSACETAAGDKRAALGLAGIAVRAGARSTLATLWSINDEATADLMGKFYQQLTNTQQTKAEALRKSQLAILKDPNYEHPIYWAPYVLIGNWL
ncbi:MULTISPECIES: CHAT domain-containing protein [Nostocales]|uniref:CHAT domain-containing protein n=3 Tax=Nostocales TaxID=1161 RepID=A0A0C1MXL6_9CYAN|nr:CHAT domain-containing protein [Tolypothrix bouteillei]KAF3889503.1 CHAT domain-containing protein [Tolypothrix bouteillei VB521301]